MSTPKVSVVIATHNSADHIGNCIDSLYSRYFSDVEIIVVDVNSTDGTKELLEQMSSEDEKITYMSDRMGSLGHARNVGMNHARAEYIVFIEPEDVLHRDALEYMSNALDENPDVDMFACETDSFGDASYGRTIKDRREAIGNANAKDNRKQEMHSRLMRSWMFDNITLYRKDYLRNNDIKFYDVPGFGKQDSAFRFLAMAKGTTNTSVAIMCSRGMYKQKQKINDARAIKDIGDEFKYLQEKLKEDTNLWWRMRLVFWQAYYDRNMMLYEKLSDELRPVMSKKMQADIQMAINNKEFSRKHFDITVRDEMELLLKSTDEFDRFQNTKIRKREQKRDESVRREKRQDTIFFTYDNSQEDNVSVAATEEGSQKKNYRINRKWLMEEMSRDLLPLRTLLGLTAEEMGNILGVSPSTYKSIESGKRDVTWDMYMALLFVFRYNDRTAAVTDTLGLFPESLELRMRKGISIGF